MVKDSRALRLTVWWIVLNTAFIRGNSMLSASVSGAISQWVKDLIGLLFPSALPGPSGHGLLRKLAHFTEFCLLGMGYARLFGMLLPGKCLSALLPLVCGGATACLDETIQYFVPGRFSSLRDVGIDTAGVVLGIVLLMVGQTILTHFRQKRLTN